MPLRVVERTPDGVAIVVRSARSPCKARRVAVVFHNTLAASEYGLLEQGTFAPRPSYWAALLWGRLMGSVVLDAAPRPLRPHVYAHCQRGRSGGVTMLAINTSRTGSQARDLPVRADRYEVPELRASSAPAGRVELAPASITFLAMPDASNAACD